MSSAQFASKIYNPDGDTMTVASGGVINVEVGGQQQYNGIIAQIGAISETVLFSAFTDGGAASGTYQMADSVPKGAILLGSKVTVGAGFAGDTSAVLTIGDGSDVDRYNTGTPSVFATAADGIETGAPSGNKLLTAANQPTLTVTSAADFTSVNAGSLTVTIFFLITV